MRANKLSNHCSDEPPLYFYDIPPKLGKGVNLKVSHHGIYELVSFFRTWTEASRCGGDEKDPQESQHHSSYWKG